MKWIMNRVNVFIFILISLTACNKEDHRDFNKNRNGEDFGVRGGKKAVRILGFDCIPRENSTPENSGIQWQNGIRNWKGGGPGGASWNVDKLLCRVEIETLCNTGIINYEFWTGSSLVSETQSTIDRTGTHINTFEISKDKWSSNLDETGFFSRNFPYDTATFKASVFLSCLQPIEIKPDTGPRNDFSDDDLFIAGFSGGE